MSRPRRPGVSRDRLQDTISAVEAAHQPRSRRQLHLLVARQYNANRPGELRGLTPASVAHYIDRWDLTVATPRATPGRPRRNLTSWPGILRRCLDRLEHGYQLYPADLRTLAQLCRISLRRLAEAQKISRSSEPAPTQGPDGPLSQI